MRILPFSSSFPGHSGGKPTTKRIEEAADLWAFLVKSLDMDVD